MGPNPNGPRSVSCDRAMIDTLVFSGSVGFLGPTLGPIAIDKKLGLTLGESRPEVLGSSVSKAIWLEGL